MIAEGLSRGGGLHRRGMPHQPAEIEEVLLGGGALLRARRGPLVDERARAWWWMVCSSHSPLDRSWSRADVGVGCCTSIVGACVGRATTRASVGSSTQVPGTPPQTAGSARHRRRSARSPETDGVGQDPRHRSLHPLPISTARLHHRDGALEHRIDRVPPVAARRRSRQARGPPSAGRQQRGRSSCLGCRAAARIPRGDRLVVGGKRA